MAGRCGPAQPSRGHVTSIVRFLEDLVAEGEVAAGYQVCVRKGGEILVDASGGIDGRGDLLQRGDLLAMYCTAKALLAMAVASLASDDELDLDDPVGDYVTDCAPHVARLTVASVLSHRSGLAAPAAADAIVKGSAGALRAAAGSPPLFPPLGSDESSYSVAAESCLVAECVRVAVGQPVQTVIRERVVEAAGCGEDFSLCDDNRERRTVCLALGGAKPMPLLIEGTRRLDTAANPGFGGFATARGLARVFEAFAGAITGRDSSLGIDPSIAARLVSPGPVRWDRVFARRCSFGLGFMTDLQTHMFGRGWSRSAFAQAGLSGLTTVVADPSLDLSASVQINGMTDLSVAGEWIRGAAWAKVRAACLAGDRP